MTLHFFTGMGADSRIWGDIARVFPEGKFHNWSMPEPLDLGFTAYVAHVIERHAISGDDWVIGVSLGAIVAAEMKNQIPSLRVIQISGCTTMQQLNLLVRMASPLARVMPFGLMRWSPSGLLAGGKTRIIGEMYRACDKRFIRWACLHLMAWRGIDPARIELAILGDRDLVFPLRRQRPHVVIPGGTHVMLVSHNERIRDVILARVS